jgi:glycerate dehydrogenase
MVRIVILDGYTLNPGDLTWKSMKSLGEVVVYDRTPVDQIITRAQGFEIVLTNKTPLGRVTLQALPGLKYVGVLATGFNVVDVAAARELGIVVTNIPAYSTMSVVQLVFAHLLEICHHVGAHGEAVRQGDWSRSADFCFWNFPLMELSGKTMGIIGYGQIGRAVARIAQVFGMKVIAVSPHSKPEPESHIRMVDLDALLRESDVISLHSPLNDSTKGIINRETLARMKDGVILINTSRGPLIVEEDLAEALKSGKVAAAGLDVLGAEPPDAVNPLLSAPNCVITPHIAWATLEARNRLMSLAVENIRAYLGGKPVNVVNT